MKEKPSSKDAGTTVVRESVFCWWDYVVYAGLTCLNLGALAFFLVKWLRLPDWREHFVAIAVMTLIILYIVAIQLFRWFLLPFMSKPRPMAARQDWKVGVATTFVPGAESFEMLEKTVEALVAMEYPHDTWVLDEGDDEEVKAMCERLGAHHFSRKDMPHYHQETGTYQTRCKHGNYNAWFAETGYDNYDIIVGVDPDHVMYPNFLHRVLGYFDDEKIGYVQAAQIYYNQDASFIARGAAEETYAYYSSIQMASYTMGYPIVTGCHQAHRVTALKEVGGFAAHDADDLLITMLYRAAGWQGVYVPEMLGKGLTPVDWAGYLAQQLRWARSVLDVKLRAYPKYAGDLPVRTRIMSLLHGFYYLQEGVINVFGVGLLAVMLATGICPHFTQYFMVERLVLLFLVLKLTDFFRQRFFLDWSGESGLHLRASVLKMAKWPYFALALADVITAKRHRPYVMTLKVKADTKQYMLLWPHLIIVGMLGVAWLIGLLSGHELHPLVRLWGAIMIGTSLLLIWTETWKFPEPFEIALWNREFDNDTRKKARG